MYRHKYNKYKYKYENLKSHIGGKLHARGDPNITDEEDIDNNPIMSDEMLDIWDDVYSQTDNKIIDKINDMIENKDKAEFEGYDIDLNTTTNDNIMADEFQQKIVDVGILGKARGKLHESYEFDKDAFTKISSKSNKNKIFRIKNKDSFDQFTDKYGEIRKIEGVEKVFIKNRKL